MKFFRRKPSERKISKRSKKSAMEDSLVNVLPDDLLLDIMTNASANSLTDFFSLKLCCRDLRRLSEEKYTYRRISLQSLTFLDWKGTISANFIKNCLDNNNPEALYREGVIEFFSRGEFQKGLQHLHDATDEGSLQACYVLAMIFIFIGGVEEELLQLGFDLLGRVCAAGKEIECREKLMSAVVNFWPNVDHDWFIQTKPDDQCMKKHRRKIHEWSGEYNYFEDKDCIECRCDAEIDRFHKKFDWRRYPFYGPQVDRNSIG